MVEENENIINIVDDEGNEMQCELYDIIEFEDAQYALLLEANVDEEDPEFVLMRYVEEGEEGFFESIDDDEEFQRVSDYIENLEFEDLEEVEE